MRGTAIVGQGFDVTLPARLGSGEQRSNLCVVAEVLFGDSQISSARVSTAITAGANAGEVLIRVRTTSAVDEPIVTLNMREGCQQKNVRQYVFLSEVLTKGAVGQILGSDEADIPMSAPRQLPASSETNIQSGQGGADALSGSSRKKFAPDKNSISKAVPSRLAGMSARLTAEAALESTQQFSRSRLKLDPLEFGPERDPMLRASAEMLTLPAQDPQQRTSAAALWQALSAQPQDVLRDIHRLKSLETAVVNMTAKTRAADAASAKLSAQLAQSRADRFNNWPLYTLATLLLLSWLVAAYLLSRDPRALSEKTPTPWWRKGQDLNDQTRMGREAGSLTGLSGGMGQAGASFSRSQGKDSMPPAARFKTIAPLGLKDRVEFSISLPSMTGMPRIVNAEELFDVQQQADFFVSLGDFEKAIEVLRNHIADNVETSAVAYLDLFDLYHQLGRKIDYEVLSEDFSRSFNAQVPMFDSYKGTTQSLEAYEAVLSRIVALWPTPKVLEVIEESIFRKPDSKSEVFSLAAYRELLLLHAIAKKVVEPVAVRKPNARNEAVEHRPSAYASTTTQPLFAHLQDLPKLYGFGPADKKADPTRPQASRHLGLDIDLNFDLDELFGKSGAAGSGLGGKNTTAGFTHELLEFEVFPVDSKAPKVPKAR